MLSKLRELNTPQLQANLFYKTQKEASHPQSQSQCPDTLFHSYQSFMGLKAVMQMGLRLSSFRVSPLGVCSCGPGITIASPASPMPWSLLPDHRSWLCRGSVQAVPWYLRLFTPLGLASIPACVSMH